MPHPERNAPSMAGMRCDRETERKAVETVIAYEKARGCTIEDVQTANLGFDLRSLHPQTGENRLIEVKGIGAARGMICLSPNEKRVPKDTSFAKRRTGLSSWNTRIIGRRART